MCAASTIDDKARKLAELIGDPVPKLTSEADLRAYGEYVENYLGLRETDASMAILRARHIVDPPDLAVMQVKFEKRQRVEEQKKSLHVRGAEGRRKQGARSRADVKKWAEIYQAKKMPRRNWAANIVKQTGLKVRRVRELLQEAGY